MIVDPTKPVSPYDTQAAAFASKWGVRMSVEYIGHGKHFADDTDTRDRYRITLVRQGFPTMAFDYGQSIVHSEHSDISRGPQWDRLLREANRRYQKGEGYSAGQVRTKPKAPTLYDILSCVEKGDTETHAEWCANLGYDTDSRKGLETYLACQEQAAAFRALCGHNADMLKEARDIT